VGKSTLRKRYDRAADTFSKSLAGPRFRSVSGTPTPRKELSRLHGLVLNLAMSQTHPLTTTTFELPGYRVTQSHGVVRGIVVRSRSIIGNIGAGIQSLFGGNITLYTELCERAREDAFNQMLAHAGYHGANAVVGVRYDATEIGNGITEVLCYGTAVSVERAAPSNV
jgi:uncharacterized protein YbjQ (UPF0145 family)